MSKLGGQLGRKIGTGTTRLDWASAMWAGAGIAVTDSGQHCCMIDFCAVDIAVPMTWALLRVQVLRIVP